MRRTGALLAVFTAVCAAQIWVPVSLIRTHERVLREGKAFKVRAHLVDPADPFRGRFVRLEFDLRTAPVSRGESAILSGKAWATLEEGPDGFARASALFVDRPNVPVYVGVRARGYAGGVVRSAERNAPRRRVVTGEVDLDLPLDRYYMTERKAPAAEKAIRERGESDRDDVWAILRVLDGVAVIEGLYVAGIPVEEYAAQPEPPPAD